MRLSKYVPLGLALVLGVGVAGCDSAPSAEPDYERVAAVELLSMCEIDPDVIETTQTVGLAGAHIAVGDVDVTIPAGAVLLPTQFVVRIPSSPYAEVEIRANGQSHFQFLLPVVISIGYGSCGVATGPLTVWHIDTVTRNLLENMGGVHDELNHRVTFSTMHLSGYAIAN